MLNRLMKTSDDRAIALIRLVLGLVFFAHGSQKMLGWFGGYGFHGTMGYFTNAMHIPALFAFLAICAEFFGALGLITGLLGRVAISPAQAGVVTSNRISIWRRAMASAAALPSRSSIEIRIGTAPNPTPTNTRLMARSASEKPTE